MVFLLGGGECYLVTVYFDSLFLDVLVYFYCLMNRDIWWGIFELIFVPLPNI
jgi:hypothetical protein